MAERNERITLDTQEKGVIERFGKRRLRTVNAEEKKRNSVQ